jgi:7-carboxy-7-deazaguanine synthase
VQQVASYKPRYVTVTGGEPLAQQTCHELLKELCDLGVEVSLETSGAMDISQVDPRVVVVMDLKTPASKEEVKNNYDNIQYIKATDQLKFVICDQGDYEWSKQKMTEYDLPAKCEVLFSPIHGELAPADLADWIVRDNLPVRMQVQLHKYLWGDEQGR